MYVEFIDVLADDEVILGVDMCLLPRAGEIIEIHDIKYIVRDIEWVYPGYNGTGKTECSPLVYLIEWRKFQK